MTEKSEASYDLVSQPWLPVRTLSGRRQELSLAEVFRRAHDLSGLTGDVPTQVFALTRLLLAILHSTLHGPRDVDEWERLWSADTLPADDVERYLGQYRDRFDLFHPETPFMQVSGLHTAKDEVSELSKLIADVPNGEPFFTTRMARSLTLTFPEAARWLVHCHAFDSSGIKSGAVGDERVKGGKGYPIGTGWAGQLGGVLLEGATLRETLLLNLIGRPFGTIDVDRERDLPAWERAPATEREADDGRGRAPDGPVDLYTWQSRRIRLVPDGDRVTGVLVCNGDKITQQNRHTVEPQTAWRFSKAQAQKAGKGSTVYMPRWHDPERMLWRGLSALLPKRGAMQGADAASSLRPETLEWLDELVMQRAVDEDLPVRVRAIGMTYGPQQATTTEIIDDVLSIHAVLVERDAESLVAVAEGSVAETDNAVRALGKLAGDVAQASGGDRTAPRDRAMEQAYAELDTPFRQWLRGLTSTTEPTDARQEWHRTARGIVLDVARGVLADAPGVAWAGRRVKGTLITTSLAEGWFLRSLAKALFLARTDTAAEKTAA